MQSTSHDRVIPDSMPPWFSLKSMSAVAVAELLGELLRERAAL